MKEHLFDKRVVQRALQEGLLDKEVYQRMLDELPDLSHKVQTAAEAEAASQASASASSAAAESQAAQAPGTDHQGHAGHAGYQADQGYGADGRGDQSGHGASLPGDTLEMERPRIPGSYTPDY